MKLHSKLQSDLFGKAISMDLECYDDPTFYNDFVLDVYKRQGFISFETYEKLSSVCNSVNCTSTRNVYIIDNNGDVAKCRKIAKSTIGNVFEESLLGVIENDSNKKYKELDRFSKCGRCAFYNVCAGSVSYTHLDVYKRQFLSC